jgi:16S rRNA (guanine527-N7)-methyltransferase
MDIARINELLQPFLADGSSDTSARLSETQLASISSYINLLLKWNAHMNLTAVREPEEIVTRHFGESFFAARLLFPSPYELAIVTHQFVDIGSGPGFPGLPIKIWAPAIHATLIEANQKKATFLREVCRAITLTNINIFSSRAEEFPVGKAQTVTLRAVERFETILPSAVRLLAPGGRLVLLISEAQVKAANQIASQLDWDTSVAIPQSGKRVVLIGNANDHRG